MQESERTIKVYFSEEASQKNLEQIKNAIEKEPAVAHIEQAGNEEAWQEFINDYFQGSISVFSSADSVSFIESSVSAATSSSISSFVSISFSFSTVTLYFAENQYNRGVWRKSGMATI